MSDWLFLSRRDIPAAVVCVALVAGFSWFAWTKLPDRNSPIRRTEATVISIRHYFPAGKSGAQASVSLVMRRDNGGEVGIDRPMRCLPQVHEGDRVKLVGVQRKAGGTRWSIVGEPCPT